MFEDKFIIIGAPRCGTTTLAHILHSHPNIEMAKPIAPEPKFWFNPDDGRKYDDLWTTDARLKGEKTTNYLESDYAFARIFAGAADVKPKIIVCLRDPVQRAISNYYWSFANGKETKTIRHALLLETLRESELNDSFMRHQGWWRYISRGRYASHLRPWLESFPVKVLFLSKNGFLDMESLWDFLEIPPHPSINTMRRLRANTTATHFHPEVESFLAKYYQHDNELLADTLESHVPLSWNEKYGV